MFREGAREALGDLGDIDSRVNALWRRMSRELRCVAVEAVLGLPSAGRLSPMHQEEAYTLERPVLEALGRILSARTRPVEGTNGWAHLLARALKATGQFPSPPVSPPPHGTWDRVLAAIARCMDHGNRLLAALEIPAKVVLVPLDCPLPENLWPPGGGTPDGRASSPGGCAGEPYAPECPHGAGTGERGDPLGSSSDRPWSWFGPEDPLDDLGLACWRGRDVSGGPTRPPTGHPTGVTPPKSIQTAESPPRKVSTVSRLPSRFVGSLGTQPWNKATFGEHPGHMRPARPPGPLPVWPNWKLQGGVTPASGNFEGG